MFNHYGKDDLVRCHCCGNLQPDHQMEYIGHDMVVCQDCYDLPDSDLEDFEDD